MSITARHNLFGLSSPSVDDTWKFGSLVAKHAIHRAGDLYKTAKNLPQNVIRAAVSGDTYSRENAWQGLKKLAVCGSYVALGVALSSATGIALTAAVGVSATHAAIDGRSKGQSLKETFSSADTWGNIVFASTLSSVGVLAGNFAGVSEAHAAEPDLNKAAPPATTPEEPATYKPGEAGAEAGRLASQQAAEASAEAAELVEAIKNGTYTGANETATIEPTKLETVQVEYDAAKATLEKLEACTEDCDNDALKAAKEEVAHTLNELNRETRLAGEAAQTAPSEEQQPVMTEMPELDPAHVGHYAWPDEQTYEATNAELSEEEDLDDPQADLGFNREQLADRLAKAAPNAIFNDDYSDDGTYNLSPEEAAALAAQNAANDATIIPIELGYEPTDPANDIEHYRNALNANRAEIAQLPADCDANCIDGLEQEGLKTVDVAQKDNVEPTSEVADDQLPETATIRLQDGFIPWHFVQDVYDLSSNADIVAKLNEIAVLNEISYDQLSKLEEGQSLIAPFSENLVGSVPPVASIPYDFSNDTFGPVNEAAPLELQPAPHLDGVPSEKVDITAPVATPKPEDVLGDGPADAADDPVFEPIASKSPSTPILADNETDSVHRFLNASTLVDSNPGNDMPTVMEFIKVAGEVEGITPEDVSTVIDKYTKVAAQDGFLMTADAINVVDAYAGVLHEHTQDGTLTNADYRQAVSAAFAELAKADFITDTPGVVDDVEPFTPEEHRAANRLMASILAPK